MLQCKKCIYGKAIPGDSHMSCSRIGTNLYKVNSHGVENGWFLFPFNFDPIWAESCDGYIPSNWRELSQESKILIVVIETESILAKRKDDIIFRKPNFFEDEHSLAIVRDEFEKRDEEDQRKILEDIVSNIDLIIQKSKN